MESYRYEERRELTSSTASADRVAIGVGVGGQDHIYITEHGTHVWEELDIVALSDKGSRSVEKRDDGDVQYWLLGSPSYSILSKSFGVIGTLVTR